MDEREAYWNDSYANYWKARVAESGAAGQSVVVTGDVKTESDEIYRRVFESTGFQPGSVLDVGCAWGRMFTMLRAFDLTVSGVDISSAMVDEASRIWTGQPGIGVVRTAIAESLPFADGAFDNLVCLATFDATFQHRAFGEFLRVVRPGGRIYVTGKNNRYHGDDEAALAAEAGARRKGHPNYFTETSMLVRILVERGHHLHLGYFFARRGDFAAFKAVQTMPDQFYEYLLVLDRGATQDMSSPLPDFSSAYSKTYMTAYPDKD